MLSRTHGQPASPTTLGKEMANVVHGCARQRDAHRQRRPAGQDQRRRRQLQRPSRAYPGGRLAALPDRLRRVPGPDWNPYTIQIEPHDYMAELFDAIADSTPCCWTSAGMSGAISRSATSDRKRWPARSARRPCRTRSIPSISRTPRAISASPTPCSATSAASSRCRWQRDLTDSTVLRNMGVGFAYSLIAWQSALQGHRQARGDPHVWRRPGRQLGGARGAHPDRDAPLRYRRAL
jgi:adenylosuccinate lyase